MWSLTVEKKLERWFLTGIFSRVPYLYVRLQLKVPIPLFTDLQWLDNVENARQGRTNTPAYLCLYICVKNKLEAVSLTRPQQDKSLYVLFLLSYFATILNYSRNSFWNIYSRTSISRSRPSRCWWRQKNRPTSPKSSQPSAESFYSWVIISFMFESLFFIIREILIIREGSIQMIPALPHLFTKHNLVSFWS